MSEGFKQTQEHINKRVLVFWENEIKVMELNDLRNKICMN